jgi:glycosyltransferase involved in cell wall biosynthesis
MQLGIVTYSLKIGGAERSIFLMAKIFQKNGFEVEVIESEDRGPWHKYFIDNGISVKSFRQNFLTIPYFHALKIARNLKRFDALFIVDSPIAQAVLGKLKDHTICFPQLRLNLPSMYFNAAANSTQWNFITANSPRLKEEFEKRYPMLAGRVKVITNGIEVPAPRDNLFNDHSYRVIYIGRLTNQQKRVDLVPEIIAKLKCKGYKVFITFLGDGPARDELITRIDELDLKNNCIFLGNVPHKDVQIILRDQDFLLMPSDTEGFPNVMLEAMANQVIPVLSYLRGITDICVKDSFNGFFGQPGNTDSFVQAFERAFAMKGALYIILEMSKEHIWI